MATAKITLTYSTTSTSATSITVKVTMHYYGNGVSYNDNGKGTITLNGTSKSFTHSFTKSTSAQTMGSASFTISKTHASRTLTASGKFVTGVSIGTLSASKSVSVPAKTSYTVSYNANGGSGAPSSQTKWYGETLTLSSTQPTKSGWTFNGWNTKSDGSGTDYSSGWSYTANSAVTLYAKWTVKSYTLTYNANGGSVSPSSITVQYGSAYGSLPTPTRNGYNFDGWWTSADGGTQVSSTTKMVASNTTIYAHWSDAYIEPRISNIEAIRCDDDGVENMAGDYVKLSFGWSKGSGSASTTIVVSGLFSYSTTSTADSGTVELSQEQLDVGQTATVTVVLTDNTTGEDYTFTIEMPAGGLPVHISESGRAVALFGTADENANGLYVNSEIYKNGNKVVTASVELKTESAKAVPSATTTNLFKLTLPAGIYIITGSASFPSNATGRRLVVWHKFSPNDTDIASTRVTHAPATGDATRIQTTLLMTADSEVTYGLNCYQNSGSSLNVTPIWRYIRLA